MADSTPDVIVAGREPRGRPRRPGVLVWLLVLAETAALAVCAGAAAHYRAEARALRHARLSVASGPASAAVTSGPASAIPEVTSVALRLPADGRVTGTVVITAAALPGGGRAQFTMSAVITGGMPGTFYDLIGSACSSADPRPDDVWATGLAGPDGTAELTGYAWAGAIAGRYWMALNPSPVNPAPGLRGQFAAGKAAPFAAGQAPCGPSS